MRAFVYVASLCLWAGTASGCVSPPSPREVLAAGFLTPEQTFRTFQTALRGDLVDLEYRCLSARFKEHFELSQLLYRSERARVVEEQPFFRLAATAEIVDRLPSPSPDHCRLVVRVDNWFVDRTYAVDLVLEGSYDVYDEAGVAEGAPLAWNDVASRRGDVLVVEVPMPEGYVLGELMALHAGKAWKIEGFEPLPSP